MKSPAPLLMLLLAVPICIAAAQAPGEDAVQADALQQRAARTFAAHSAVAKPKPAVKAALTPLTPRERVVQLLDRFTFGPRAGWATFLR